MYDGWSNQISHAARPIRKHCPDLGSDASSVWNFWARFSDVIWRGNQWWRAQMSAVFSSYDDRTGQKFDLDFNVQIFDSFVNTRFYVYCSLLKDLWTQSVITKKNKSSGKPPTSSPGSSRFPIWRRQERRPWHTAEITWLICPRKVEIYSKWRPS